jgi:hypothetical protein
MTLSNFYEGTTKKFDVTITYNGSNPDITSDTVTIYFKEKEKDEIALEKEADVTTQGADGIAEFELTTTNTDLRPGIYTYSIVWEPASGGKYILEEDKVRILDSITVN